MPKTCWGEVNDLMAQYHDEEWGMPVHDDQKLFEILSLDAFQAGLSWETILKKRENFRAAFDNFDYNKIAKYDEKKISELLEDAGIVRHRGKIEATIGNVKALIAIQGEYGSFDKYIWQFVDGKTIHNPYNSWEQMSGKTSISDEMSKQLKKRGFKFVGSSICCAFMQAAGLVNDHLVQCPQNEKIRNL
jgi:DNA-3-methyladenine glycosylase I